MASTVPSVDLPNGGKMPILGYGTYRCLDEEAIKTTTAALECGYRHIDTATFYKNEEAIGDALQPWLTSGRIKREDLFITTKLPHIANRAADVSRFLDASLKKFKLTYVDLYLLHAPYGLIMGKDEEDMFPKDADGNITFDYETDIESLYAAMEEQVDRGKAKAIGISNFNSEQIERIMKVCRIKPANTQIELHAYHQQKKLRAVCAKHGITVCAYAPFGAPYFYKSVDSPLLIKNPTVGSIAERLNKTHGQILLRFIIQLGIPVIPMSSNPQRIKQNFEVFDFELSPTDMATLDSIDQGEKGRLFVFTEFFKGVDKHPEYPFHIPY